MSNVPCPNCGSYLTERQYQSQEADLIEQVWTCKDCPAEFEAWYDLFECELTDMGKEMVAGADNA